MIAIKCKTSFFSLRTWILVLFCLIFLSQTDLIDSTIQFLSTEKQMPKNQDESVLNNFEVEQADEQSIDLAQPLLILSSGGQVKSKKVFFHTQAEQYISLEIQSPPPEC